MKKYIICLLILLSFLFPLNVNAKDNTKSNEVSFNETIYLFYGKECPHCEGLIKYLNQLLKDEKYKDVKLEKYEVWYSEENSNKMDEVGKVLHTSASGVPFFIIGTNSIIGYDTPMNEEFKTLIDFYYGKKYYDPAGDYLHKTDTSKYEKLHYEKENKNEYKVPLLGKVNAKNVSLLLVSIIIGAVDGFNPCAMWILLFLLSLLISTKDRKKMWLLGLTFILTSGIVYLLFMVSWLNVAKYTSKIIFIRYLIGIFALIFGLINVYRYLKSLKEKDVGCDVTNASKKRKIMNKIRNILTENKLLFAVLGIMLLAISVNLIELLCSLGLPVMYTEMLGLNNLSTFEYGIYLFIYILFFLIDDLVIFFIAMKTLKIKGISNKYMKYSHLIGGVIMLIIGILMIIKPAWLLFNF
ncbi:MAG: hypothetical protein IKX00_04375 [Bacilli bacterium]|nr:hypothetical protein [Bacilli bacterium]